METLALLVIGPVVLVYLTLVKGMDRYEPEPTALLTLAFAWGAVVATGLAMVGNAVGHGVLSVVMEGADADLIGASTATFVAPLVEESTKGVGLLLLWAVSAAWLHEFDGPLDGVIFGGVIGLGFTLTEDVLYVANAGADFGAAGFFGLFVLRTVLAGLGHASFTALTGLGVGIAAEAHSPVVKLVLPVVGWAGAVGLHGLHNLLATFALGDGEGLVLKLVLFWLIDLVFFVLLLALALRDRAIVKRELEPEVGTVLTARELAHTVSRWVIVPFANRLRLASAPGGYEAARARQLDLVNLAFLKHRRRRGGPVGDGEQALRARLAVAAARGVRVGSAG